MRKMISFKLENLPEKERIIVNEWASAQSNIQQSLSNAIMHIVSNVGMVDVMDFDVQRQLHDIFSNERLEGRSTASNDSDEHLPSTEANGSEKEPETLKTSNSVYDTISIEDFE